MGTHIPVGGGVFKADMIDLRTYFVHNGIMSKGEEVYVVMTATKEDGHCYCDGIFTNKKNAVFCMADNISEIFVMKVVKEYCKDKTFQQIKHLFNFTNADYDKYSDVPKLKDAYDNEDLEGMMSIEIFNAEYKSIIKEGDWMEVIFNRDYDDDQDVSYKLEKTTIN